MDHIGFGPACALLLLIQCGNGAGLNITSPDPSPLILIGDTINLNISYSSTPSFIMWTANDSIVTFWIYGGQQFIAAGYQNRLTLQEKSLSINGSTKADSGQYMVRVNDTNDDFGSFAFNVVVRERTQEIQSNDTGIYKTGDNISLTIWYEGQPSAIFWNYNGSPLVIRAEVYNYISPRFDGRTILKEDGSLLIYNTSKDDAGDYTVNVATSIVPGTRSFEVKFYDAIKNVTVQQNPAIVDDNTPLVNLSCKALSGSGSVTWQKDGQPVNNVSTHILDQDLQILQPNETFSGTYSCNMSNLVSWDVGSIKLMVYYPVKNVTVTQSPQTVSENTSLLNLSCDASRGNIETVTWMKDGQSIDNTYKLLDGNQTLQIIQPNRTFSGNYSCNISNPAYWGSGFHQLRVYDPVENVKVTQSPDKVNKKSPLVNLSCSASSGYIEEVTWTKDGQSVISKDAYSLLDGNRTLQITKPNENFNGIYTCKMSNAAYFGLGSINLTVSYSPLGATSTFAVIITSLLGGILLSH